MVILLKKGRNKKYFYRFYADRLVYRDRFFTNKTREIMYSDFKEVRYNQGLLQSRFHLGELYILTNNRNFLNKIVHLKNVPNVEKNYEKIVELFNA